MYDIFLSYSTQDRERLLPLFHALEQRGWSVFWDHRTIDIGEHWNRKIDQAIRSSKCVVVVWSTTSVESEWVLEEATIGKLRDVLLPIRIDNVVYPVGFTMRQTGDFTAWEGDPANPEFLRLTAKIRELLEEHDAQARREAEQAAAERKRLKHEKALAEQKAREVEKQQRRQEEEKRQSKAAAIPARERLEREIAEAGRLAREATRHEEENKAKHSANLLDGKLLNESEWPFWKRYPLQVGIVAVLFAIGMTVYMQQTDKGKPESVPAPEPKTAPSTLPTQQVAAKSAEPERLPFESEMVEIPAGKFTMGCVEGRDDVEGGCDDDEKPAHKVSISAFKLAKTEVTVSQYMECVKQGGCNKPAWDSKDASSYYTQMGGALKGRDYPIVGVSWNDATEYVKWLAKETGEPYRLPTEAEWEYAARGGKDGAFSWGQKGSEGCSYANMADQKVKEKFPDWMQTTNCNDGYIYTAPVASFKPNAFDLHDMHGNVWEWVQDWKADYAAEPLEDPKWLSKGYPHVLRGGSWNNLPRSARSALRTDNTPNYRFYDLGFRPALGQ